MLLFVHHNIRVHVVHPVLRGILGSLILVAVQHDTRTHHGGISTRMKESSQAHWHNVPPLEWARVPAQTNLRGKHSVDDLSTLFLTSVFAQCAVEG